MMVVSPLPMEASVSATSGAASSKNSTEAVKLTNPDAITATDSFWL